jgi:hypothetical protein
MINYDFTTPTILFSALSLLLLAYTNRFMGLTQVIRGLHQDYLKDKNNKDFYYQQIQSLHKRLNLIVYAQKTGILSLILGIIAMLVLLMDHTLSLYIFIVSLSLLMVSLGFIFQELTLSRYELHYILNVSLDENIHFIEASKDEEEVIKIV